MPKRSSSRDANVAAFSMLQQVAEGTRPPFNEASAVLDNMALRRKVMQEMGRLGGLKGGKARAASLSKEKRKAIARKAALSRWKSP